jgi:hypothetical protein
MSVMPLGARKMATQMSKQMEMAVSLLDSVYGQVDAPGFPLPMASDEAGPCADGQRRYLWTDAFGVLALQSIADTLDGDGQTDEAKKFKKAVNTLIDTVHRCLGKPRSEFPSPEDAMLRSEGSPTGHVGLRIGKVRAKSYS